MVASAKRRHEEGSSMDLDDLTQLAGDWFLRPDGSDGALGIHGLGHTLRVSTHASEIADALDLAPWEREALSRAALWHDIGRTHDGADYYHGAKSAGKVVGMGLSQGMDPVVLETALFAVTHHCGSERHAERAAEWTVDPDAALRVFRVLKDADALDRVRLGDLDVSFLRFEVSRSRVDRAWELLGAVTPNLA
jgi:putative nucleotidyltransferase with HDIG domain